MLDVAPVRPASKARPSAEPHRVVDERGWVDLALLVRLTGAALWTGRTVGSYAVSDAALERTNRRLQELVESAGALGLDVAVLDDRERAALAMLEPAGISVHNGRATFQAAADPLAEHPFVRALEGAPFSPPDATGIDRAELRELIRRGLVVERDGAWFAPAAIEAAARIVAGLLESRPGGVTVAEVRDALGTTRKHMLPLLAQLDATGVTRRRGDTRVAGPKLPSPG